LGAAASTTEKAVVSQRATSLAVPKGSMEDRNSELTESAPSSSVQRARAPAKPISRECRYNCGDVGEHPSTLSVCIPLWHASLGSICMRVWGCGRNRWLTATLGKRVSSRETTAVPACSHTFVPMSRYCD